MTDWMRAGNVAVITGGASGIGLAAAHQFAGQNMHVVIADREEDALGEAESSLASHGGEIMAVTCDVADIASVHNLRDAVYDRFGAVHCLMNNAGMAVPAGLPWEDLDALQQLMAVNLGGVVHGCHAFIPKMLEAGHPAAVINTGSKQGITKPPGNYAYNLSKAGVLAYTESVAHGFTTIEGCPISAHLLVPGFVYTGMIKRFLPEQPPSAWTPEQTVAFMVESLERRDFYILCPDNDVDRATDEKRIQWNTDDIIKNRPALSRWHPDWADAFADFMKE